MTPETRCSAAVALVNSADEPDTMTTLEELDAFYDEHGYTGATTPDPSRAGGRPGGPRPTATSCSRPSATPRCPW